MVDLKIYDVTTWETNNCNTHITNISRNAGNQRMKDGQSESEYNMKNIFIDKSFTKCW